MPPLMFLPISAHEVQVSEADRPGTAPTKYLKPDNVRTRPLPLYRWGGAGEGAWAWGAEGQGVCSGGIPGKGAHVCGDKSGEKSRGAYFEFIYVCTPTWTETSTPYLSLLDEPVRRDINFTFHGPLPLSHYTDFDELGPQVQFLGRGKFSLFPKEKMSGDVQDRLCLSRGHSRKVQCGGEGYPYTYIQMLSTKGLQKGMC